MINQLTREQDIKEIVDGITESIQKWKRSHEEVIKIQQLLQQLQDRPEIGYIDLGENISSIVSKLIFKLIDNIESLKIKQKFGEK